MGCSNTTPTTAAGMKAMRTATATVRPCGSRPSTPSTMDRMRRWYRRTTAMMAPAWMVTA